MKPTNAARDAIAIVAQRTTAKSGSPDPQKHYERTLNDLRGRLWDDALAYATENPDLDAHALADLLDPGSAVTPTSEMFPELHRPELETYEPDAWKPLEGDDVDRAKARIAAIRESLRGGDAA